MREIEIKLRVKDLEDVKKRLKEMNYIISEPISQHDVNYSLKGSKNEFESAREGNIIIRLRHLKNTVQLNLKQQRSSEGDNIEYETEIKNPEEIHKMLATLGWYPAVEVKKIRRKCKLGEYEICLDEVEKLGTFVEIEKITDNDVNPNEIKEELFKKLETLGLSRNDEETKGYDTQIYSLSKKINHLQSKNNYAFIDGQNLYLAIQELGWKLDYKRFRTYLREKYKIEKVYMFMGFMETNKNLYDFLQKVGFNLIFKPLLENKNHEIKGNCDAELVMQTMIDIKNYNKAMLITGDGDFHCLIKHLNSENKLLKILAPSTKNCSSLIKKAAGKKISFVSDLRNKLEYKRKGPSKDKP